MEPDNTFWRRVMQARRGRAEAVRAVRDHRHGGRSGRAAPPRRPAASARLMRRLPGRQARRQGLEGRRQRRDGIHCFAR